MVQKRNISIPDIDSLHVSWNSGLEAILQKGIENERIRFSTNGHYYNGGRYPAYLELFRGGLKGRIFSNKLVNVIVALCEGKIKKSPCSYNLGSLCYFPCTNCGEYLDWILTDKFIQCQSQCPYPKGLPPLELELNVPSGKIVFGNDFRDKFCVLGDYDINNALGICKTSRAYQNVGMIHCLVGNTCPGIYQNIKNKNNLRIGVPARKKRTLGTHYREVGGITTDLWWYCAVDYDDFVRRYKEEPKGNSEVVINVQPGLYKFTHLHHLLSRDFKKDRVYTHISRIGVPHPVKDFDAEFNRINLTAGQIIKNEISRYPDLYSESGNIENPTPRDCFAAANHILVTLGGGGDYHPNGFWQYDPEMTNDSPDMEIPFFNFPYEGYPIYPDCRLAAIAGVAKNDLFCNESFVKLAFNIARQLVLFGSKTNACEAWAAKENEENVRLGRIILGGLIKKYPYMVPQDCKNFLRS